MSSILLPNDLKYLNNVNIHQVTFDVTRAAAGLVFDNRSTMVTQNVSPQGHKCVLGTDGYNSGVHYWSFEIIEHSIDAHIMIGVAKNIAVTTSTFPGHAADKGVSYFGATGHRYFANTNAAFAPIFKKGDVVGTLLNMEHKTVTYYLNGSRVGTAIGRDQLTDDLYYPCVSLYTLGHSVVSPEVPASVSNGEKR